MSFPSPKPRKNQNVAGDTSPPMVFVRKTRDHILTFEVAVVAPRLREGSSILESYRRRSGGPNENPFERFEGNPRIREAGKDGFERLKLCFSIEMIA